MIKPVAIVIGFMGKIPLAGMSLANLHTIVGLQELGYDVHYLERQNKPDQCYDPNTNQMTDDPSFAVKYIENLLPGYGLKRERFSFIDRVNVCHGSGWKGLKKTLAQADFVLAVGDATWFDELELCTRRAFIDVDPMFTQVDLIEGKSTTAKLLANYDTLFTYGIRLGQEDCKIPSAGRSWITSLPGIATCLWNVKPGSISLPVTNLMNWESGKDICFEDEEYGYKNREFLSFIDLPMRSSQEFVLAVGGPAPRDELQACGWQLISPLRVSATIPAYMDFIAGSSADFGVAKHAYVASRSGWFSDRSTCYLASGRPVIHQDTGFGDWVPTGQGLFSFSQIDQVPEILDTINSDYEKHSKAARHIAEEYFEAKAVIGRMLDEAGYR